ncbi:hypothetical protein B0H13DRAFT_1908825 [Mycena leptocephala]|nr:hypothetical protein B0H13DRAFT_1908825 [Mycena leptocephala]
MPRGRSGCCGQCCAIFGAIFATGLLVAMIFGIKDHIQRIIVIQQQLLSRMSDDTPISGFYGPGAWWAWLITMGMAHGHLIKALWVSGHIPDEWDYDLIGASYYIVVAAIDLMLKARAISQLGDAASASKLLPALVCAERVVSLGTGSSLFSIVISLSFGRSSGTRTAGIAVIPLMFALVASGFTLHAHQAIARTMPVIWCRMHDGSELGKREDIPFTLVEFPAIIGDILSYFPSVYTHDYVRQYALVGAKFTGIVIAVIFLISLLRRRNLGRALRSASQSGATALGIWFSLPILAIPIFTALGAAKWLCYWVCLWWPIYILAWFPQMGFFPISGISILEMDQIAAPLPIVVVAAIRTFGPLLKRRGGVIAAGPEEASVVPGAFTVDANKRVPAPVVDQEMDVTDTERS